MHSATISSRTPTLIEWHEFVGGKCRNLDRLALAGMPVPRWSAVPTNVLDEFARRSGLAARIDQTIAEIGARTVNEVAELIADLVEATELDVPALEQIEHAYVAVGADAVAVRSSGVDEDGHNLSFAGQHESFLNVVGFDEVAKHVKRCWASAWSARALAYRQLHGLSMRNIQLAVILQVVVPAEVSGVVFTSNPVSGRSDELLVSAIYGLGESLVSGMVDADTITLDRATGAVRDQVIGEKHERLDPSLGGGCAVETVASDRRATIALNGADIETLRTMALRIERLFGHPQDIEWAIADGRLWILQSRPITSARRHGESREVRVWDNSNIVESFGDVTAPLTFSFARHVYQRVYHEYCELLGVPRRQLERMNEWLPNMLGYFDGRVYYNLLNWYKVIGLLPGYKLQRRILAAAMGVREVSDELADQQNALVIRSRAIETLVRARIAFRFTRLFFTVNRAVKRFLADFDAVIDEFEAVDLGDISGEQAYALYTQLERKLLVRWGNMAALDATLSLSYGALHILTDRWLPDAPDWFRWEVVNTSERGIESSRPAHRLVEMAEGIRDDHGLVGLIERTPPAEVLSQLEHRTVGRAPWLLVEVRGYIDEFGDRNVNELKLEEPDLRDDPAAVVSQLRDALSQLDQPGRATGNGATHDADAYLRSHLAVHRRVLFGLVRRKVRHSLQARESVRFARSRAFGMARRAFRAIGRDFERTGALAVSQDVFFLKLEELRACFAGTIAHRELAPIAELRRNQQVEQRRMAGPAPRFLTFGNPYWGEMRADAAAEDDLADGSSRLRGTPCCPGHVIGEARVVSKPRDIGGKILVTYRTDPGWVGALSSASALLIERGSPMTHVAVVARELGIPTVVQIPKLTERVQTGMTITVDGSAGTVELPMPAEAAPVPVEVATQC